MPSKLHTVQYMHISSHYFVFPFFTHKHSRQKKKSQVHYRHKSQLIALVKQKSSYNTANNKRQTRQMCDTTALCNNLS